MNGEHLNRRTTAPEVLTAQESKARALKLRMRGNSYRAIARALGCSLSTAHGYITDALSEIRAECKESAEQLREIEIAKLDAAEKEAWKRMRGADDADAAKLLNTIKAISESRRKLTGLDAPVKIEQTGNLYTVLQASPDCVEWSQPQRGADGKVNDASDAGRAGAADPGGGNVGDG